MGNLCIIPARGGSKRIPKKNIRHFLGKPIIAYSIQAALDSKLFDEVMISTDDHEIADIAKQYGAKVPFLRSKEKSDDFASTYDVIEEVLQEYEEIGKKFEYACCIYPCAPFINKNKLLEAYTKLKEENFDTVLPVIPYSSPIQRALKINDRNSLEFINREYLLNRSQDLETSYHDAGQFYWFNPTTILEKKVLLTDNIGAVVISELEGQDIDNEIDWKIAELKYKLIINE